MQGLLGGIRRDDRAAPIQACLVLGFRVPGQFNFRVQGYRVFYSYEGFQGVFGAMIATGREQGHNPLPFLLRRKIEFPRNLNYVHRVLTSGNLYRLIMVRFYVTISHIYESSPRRVLVTTMTALVAKTYTNFINMVIFYISSKRSPRRVLVTMMTASVARTYTNFINIVYFLYIK